MTLIPQLDLIWVKPSGQVVACQHYHTHPGGNSNTTNMKKFQVREVMSTSRQKRKIKRKNKNKAKKLIWLGLNGLNSEPSDVTHLR